MTANSTPSLHRDTREINYLKQASSNLAVNTHSISPPSHSNNSYSIMRNVGGDTVYGGANIMHKLSSHSSPSDINLSGSTGSTMKSLGINGEFIAGESTRKELSVLYDRINSMSSSNESVCSTSSRDLNRQLNWDYSMNQQLQSKDDESSQTFLPKKTQRGHKIVTSSKHEPSL